MKPRGCFITATGTGVGKTFVTAALTRALRAQGAEVFACKPVASGFDAADPASDTALLLESLGWQATAENIARISPFRFAAPLSPDMAAEREGCKLDFAEVLAFCKTALSVEADHVLIEGVGGVMVPLGGGKTMLDLMAGLGIPALLVAGSYLGTLSHTLTALHALQSRGIPVASVVCSESEDSPVPLAETIASLESCLAIPVKLVKLPRQADKGAVLPGLLAALPSGG